MLTFRMDKVRHRGELDCAVCDKEVVVLSFGERDPLRWRPVVKLDSYEMVEAVRFWHYAHHGACAGDRVVFTQVDETTYFVALARGDG